MFEIVTEDSYDYSDDELADILIDGKTKQVYEFPPQPGHCLIWRKDLGPFDYSARAQLIQEIIELLNTMNGQVFQLLNGVGVRTAYVRPCSSFRKRRAFIAKKCEMIPITWMTTRLAASAAFLKRNPGIQKDHRFSPPKLETFYKDADVNPMWSEDEILAVKFTLNGLLIGKDEIEIIKRTTKLVFEILEKAWAARHFTLVDLKVEYGVDKNGTILLADVIDSNSWSLWPSGGKADEFEREVNVNFPTVNKATLKTIKNSFTWISAELNCEIPKHLVVILMIDGSDVMHCAEISSECEKLGLETELRVVSEFEGPENIIDTMRSYEFATPDLVFIAVAGLGIANGLEQIPSGSIVSPIINCPPVKQYTMDSWSGLRHPTILLPRSAAMHAAQILGVKNYMIWSKLRCQQLKDYEMSHKKSKKRVRLAGNVQN